jgi:hypothetical protein
MVLNASPIPTLKGTTNEIGEMFGQSSQKMNNPQLNIPQI